MFDRQDFAIPGIYLDLLNTGLTRDFQIEHRLGQRCSASSSTLTTDTVAVPPTLATAVFSAVDCDNFARPLNSASEIPFAGWIEHDAPANVGPASASATTEPSGKKASSYVLLAETDEV